MRPFDDVRRALSDISHQSKSKQNHPDSNRAGRTGAPEIVYGRAKTPEQIAEGLIRLSEANGRAIATRCSIDQLQRVQALLPEREEGSVKLDAYPDAGVIVAVQHGPVEAPLTGGRIGILTAGTSDRSVALEAELIARELGVTVEAYSDVGVAGLHRLVRPLEALMASDVDAVMVVAGMDGALPSVVAGLVSVPVIAVPTSTGYGFGGDGTGALMTMLQSCAPGVAVVNIDNGVGAAILAASIANRCASFRRS
jgi:pyridinium-3,5-biscarboxylic acid mononucleotide synthase